MTNFLQLAAHPTLSPSPPLPHLSRQSASSELVFLCHTSLFVLIYLGKCGYDFFRSIGIESNLSNSINTPEHLRLHLMKWLVQSRIAYRHLEISSHLFRLWTITRFVLVNCILHMFPHIECYTADLQEEQRWPRCLTLWQWLVRNFQKFFSGPVDQTHTIALSKNSFLAISASFD